MVSVGTPRDNSKILLLEDRSEEQSQGQGHDLPGLPRQFPRQWRVPSKTPDVCPQAARFRLDTTSLRGMFNQQIHGSRRSLRSVEDFTECEQRTAYFYGDHVSAMRKGANLPDRPTRSR